MRIFPPNAKHKNKTEKALYHQGCMGLDRQTDLCVRIQRLSWRDLKHVRNIALNTDSSLLAMSSSSSSRNSLHQALGKSALIQLIERQRKQLSESEKMELTKKVESSCNRFDQTGKGRLSVDDLYNVVRLQNKIDATKDDIRSLVQDLDMDRDQTVSIEDFVYMPIISEAVFAAMDKNKDGVVSKGELKMAQKTMTMKELKEIIDSIDENSDGLLTYEEIKAMSKRAYTKKNSKRSTDKDAKSKSKSKGKSRSKNRAPRDKSNSQR